jgi:hypothetical protein
MEISQHHCRFCTSLHAKKIPAKEISGCLCSSAMKGNLLVQAAFASLTQHGQLGKTMIETVRGMTSTCTVNWTHIAQLRHFGVEIC